MQFISGTHWKQVHNYCKICLWY